MEYPETLYVVEEEFGYPYTSWNAPGVTRLVGKPALENVVPDNGKENVVAVYQLVDVGRYKKTVTRTSVVEKV